MLWDFHGLVVEGVWSDALIGERWAATFASRPRAGNAARPDAVFRLELAEDVPAAPQATPDFKQGDLLAYYARGSRVTAHFPRFGQLTLDLSRATTDGLITSAALATYGVFEDLIAIGLSPHFRRRGMFLIHAFAASPPVRLSQSGRGGAVLIVGDIGAGKTTTGLSLLHAGWKLLSNDSPILRHGGELEVLSYPGLLSAYPDSLLRFPELHRLVTTDELPPTNAERRKITFAAERFYADVWIDRASPGALVLPQIERRADHTLEPLSKPEALQLILPHAIEPWDQEMIPAHFALLRELIEVTPAFRLRLGPETSALSGAIATVLA
ncbi:MAG: hypothetical protein HY023_06225 [Chloroflexi bacterium]|nr:hypothetical protein [Chloroflexota bacterium]